jgi:hypothetical protein
MPIKLKVLKMWKTALGIDILSLEVRFLSLTASVNRWSFR